MPNYMLLFYTSDAEPEEQARREAEMPEWRELLENLGREGVLVGHNRLLPTEAATTLRVRDGDTEISDGPFAATKEYLAGYIALECRDLDHALEAAERVPLARYGSVEVRPVAPE